MKISKDKLIEIIKEEIQKIDEDFAGAFPEQMRKKFDGKRRKQSEVLGYKLTGTPDVKTEIGDATIKEGTLRRFKVYVSGESQPLILMGKNEREVKKLAYMMIRNSSVKIRKVVKEQKLNESWDSAQAFSSNEAKRIMDNSLKLYAKELRKVQYKVVKDWMSKAKSGVIDFFDIYRGLTHGDIRRAHPYETEFLQKVLTKDKIIDRFRKYFGGKKGKRGRRK
jgi:hypothetical protein